MKRKSFFLGYGIRHWFISDSWRRAFSAIVPRAIVIKFLVRLIFFLFNVASFRRPLIDNSFLWFSSFSPSCLQCGWLCQHVKERFRKFSAAKVVFDWWRQFFVQVFFLFIFEQIKKSTDYQQITNKNKRIFSLLKIPAYCLKSFSIENCPILLFFDWPILFGSG